MNSLISIIIPVYNHEEALQEVLRSIYKQTYKNLEVFIVDDGSEPKLETRNWKLETGDGIRKSGLSVYPDITVLHQIHSGAPSARNRGLQEAKGEYVIFWDADVIAESTMLEKMKAALDAHPETSYAYSDFYFGKKKMPARAFDGDALKEMNYIHSTSLIRRSAAIQWDETLKRFQDWDLWLTMLEQGKRGVWMPEYLFTVLPHPGGMSAWLPSFAYRAPWRWLPGVKRRVIVYEEAKRVILNKHFN